MLKFSLRTTYRLLLRSASSNNRPFYSCRKILMFLVKFFWNSFHGRYLDFSLRFPKFQCMKTMDIVSLETVHFTWNPSQRYVAYFRFSFRLDHPKLEQGILKNTLLGWRGARVEIVRGPRIHLWGTPSNPWAYPEAYVCYLILLKYVCNSSNFPIMYEFQ